MRPIKFRAWDKQNNIMVFPKDGTRFHDSEGCFPDDIIEITHYHHGWEWMQFIGLTDKNMRDIYDGDLVIWHGQKCVIQYRGLAFLIIGLERYRNKSVEFSEDTITADIQYSRDIEVIGNRYENPELLEVKP